MQELENWLGKLEQNLEDLPPTKKSQIVLDLDKKIRTQIARGLSIEEVLLAFGSPEQAATRAKFELTSESAPIPPPPRSRTARFWKWATLILLGGFFAIIALFILVPLLIFKLFTFNSFNKEMNFSLHNSTSHISGTQQEVGLQHFIFKAGNGTLTVKADGSVFSYSCDVSGSAFGADRVSNNSNISRPQPATLQFDLTDATSDSGDKMDCSLTLPSSSQIDIELQNGDIKLSNIQQDITVHLQKGRIDLNKKADVVFEVSALASAGEIVGLKELNEKQNQLKDSQSPHRKANLQVEVGQIQVN
jgi:hypothetical protein